MALTVGEGDGELVLLLVDESDRLFMLRSRGPFGDVDFAGVVCDFILKSSGLFAVEEGGVMTLRLVICVVMSAMRAGAAAAAGDVVTVGAGGKATDGFD